MKIKNIKIRFVKIPAPKKFHFAWMPGFEGDSLGFTMVEIETDEGIKGIGTSHLCNDIQIATSIRELYKPYLIGKNPFEVEKHMNVLFNGKVFGSPPWILSQALWDIIGKRCNQPLYRLWGACREKVLAYAAPAEPRGPKALKDLMIQYKEEGFKAVKLRFHNWEIKDDIALVEAAREAIGSEMEIMVDANQALKLISPLPHPVWDYKRALITARELEKLNVFFLEEPLPIYDFENLSKLTSETDIYIAGGECNMGLHEFKLLLEKGCYDILQPDATLSEGMFQIRKIAAMALASNKMFIPHTWGNGIGLFANFQIALTVPDSSSPFFEYPYDPETWPIEFSQAMIENPLKVDKNGYVNASNEPGIGFKLNYEVIDKYTKFEEG